MRGWERLDLGESVWQMANTLAYYTLELMTRWECALVFINWGANPLFFTFHLFSLISSLNYNGSPRGNCIRQLHEMLKKVRLHLVNRTECIRHLCWKTVVLSCQKCIKTLVLKKETRNKNIIRILTTRCH